MENKRMENDKDKILIKKFEKRLILSFGKQRNGKQKWKTKQNIYLLVK